MIRNDTLRIEYWPLEKCLTKKWKRNQKRHDMGAIMQSIQRYGFKDPLHYDETLDGFDEGNGRTDAIQAIKAQGESPPRGIRVDAQGTWFVPVGLGVDAATVAEAEAYAIDHNNTTLMGGDFDLTDLMRQWDDGLTDVLEDLARQTALPVSMDAEDLDRLLVMSNGKLVDDPMGEWEGMPEFEQEDLSAWKSIKVNFANEDDWRRFIELTGCKRVTKDTRSCWFPEARKPEREVYE